MQPAQHTDQCIRDAARFGFCDHTRLVARPAARPPSPSPSPSPSSPRTRRARYLREVLAYLGLAAVAGTTVYLARHLPTAAVFWVIPVFSLGWLLVFTCGLPRLLHDALMLGPEDILPPDASRRLREEIAPHPDWP